MQRTTTLVRLGCLGVLALGLNLPAEAQQVCSRTAGVARKASAREAQADFWNAIGNCLNLSDPSEVLECVADAVEELTEALDEVNEQFKARIELCSELGEGPYDPDIDPADFTSNVTNPYFPLTVGTTLAYEGTTSEGFERVECTTLAGTRDIDGVECAIVHAVEFLDGEVIEDTFDYYAQHTTTGDVWYFGELSFELEEGNIVNMDGSWIHGQDDAKAGIIMRGAVSPGLVYRQEWFLNEAEDIGTFVATGQMITVPYNGGTTYDCWQIEDTTPIEPDAAEYKYYASGVGLVQEYDVESGEHIDLVDIIVN